MSTQESLQDVTIRERQLEAHILRSAAYLRRADQELKRQVSMIYLAIALLVVFQGLFTFREVAQVPIDGIVLMSVTSVLAIITCLLLIRTKAWLRRVNEDWLAPQEKLAIDSLKHQRQELLTRLPRPRKRLGKADLN